MQRAKLQVMRLTSKAADRIKDIMATSQKQAVGLRIGVKNGGCAGMEYTIDYAENAEPLDEIVEEHDVKLFIEPKAVLFLLGTEMDYEIDKLSSGFVFNNPNQTSACGCGESVEIQPVSRAQLEAYAKNESALGGS